MDKRRKMDKKQKIVMVLLIIAILFSVISVVINIGFFSVSDSKAVSRQVSADNSKGSVNLYIEASKVKEREQR